MSEERFIRMCPTHNLELDGLECPRGHHVTCWDVVDRDKGRALSRADLEKGELYMSNAEVKEQATIQRQRFIDAKRVLVIRLVQRPAPKFGGDPFVVRWQLEDGKKKEQGVLATSASNEEALQLYAKHVRDTEKAGWEKSEFSGGGRRTLTIKPVPAPLLKTRRTA